MLVWNINHQIIILLLYLAELAVAEVHFKVVQPSLAKKEVWLNFNKVGAPVCFLGGFILHHLLWISQSRLLSEEPEEGRCTHT